MSLIKSPIDLKYNIKRFYLNFKNLSFQKKLSDPDQIGFFENLFVLDYILINSKYLADIIAIYQKYQVLAAKRLKYM